MQADSKPNPLSWTLRFKNHNVTVVLLVSPTEPLEGIRKTLLKALQVRGIEEINGVQIPEQPSEIELGVPIDRNNLEKGWVRLELANGDSSNTGSKKNAIIGDSPQALDLRDSQAVAFRFRSRGREEINANGEESDMDVDDLGWDVMIPTYEDDEEEQQEQEQEEMSQDSS